MQLVRVICNDKLHTAASVKSIPSTRCVQDFPGLVIRLRKSGGTVFIACLFVENPIAMTYFPKLWRLLL